MEAEVDLEENFDVEVDAKVDEDRGKSEEVVIVVVLTVVVNSLVLIKSFASWGNELGVSFSSPPTDTSDSTDFEGKGEEYTVLTLPILSLF